MGVGGEDVRRPEGKAFHVPSPIIFRPASVFPILGLLYCTPRPLSREAGVSQMEEWREKGRGKPVLPSSAGCEPKPLSLELRELVPGLPSWTVTGLS